MIYRLYCSYETGFFFGGGGGYGCCMEYLVVVVWSIKLVLSCCGMSEAQLLEYWKIAEV
jgi:hypothetical protein